ncbi:unnamed protein product [Prunus armeniaca]
MVNLKKQMWQPEGFAKEGKQHMDTKELLSNNFEMKDFGEATFVKVPLAKGDLKKKHCPKNKEEEAELRNKPYASLIRSIMYSQVCSRLDTALCIRKMWKFQLNPEMQHWIAGKKILGYLLRTKVYMLIYKRRENLELVDYVDANHGKVEDDYISTSSFLFKMYQLNTKNMRECELDKYESYSCSRLVYRLAEQFKFASN